MTARRGRHPCSPVRPAYLSHQLDEIVAYLSQFTEWRPYEHRVLADIGGVRLPMPINRTTLEALFDRPLPDDAAAERLLAKPREPVPTIATPATS